MGNKSSSRPSQPNSQYLLSQETHSPNGSTMNKLTVADKASHFPDDNNVTQYLISFNVTLERDSNHDYILPNGAYFHFNSYKPNECIIVCLSCSFNLLHDHSNLKKEQLQTVLEKLLNNKGLPDVSVCVLLTENHTATEKNTSTTKDITLKVRIPSNVCERGITEHDIMTVLNDHLSPKGYKIQSIELFSTLLSSESVTLKKSETDENIKLIPKETNFTFYDYASTEPNQPICLTAIDNDYPLFNSTYPEWEYYTSQTSMKLSENYYHMIVIQLTYYFNQDLYRSEEKLSPEAIGNYLKNTMRSSDFQMFSVITNFEAGAAAYTAGAWHSQEHPLWVGVNVWLFREGMNVPNVYQHLGAYFYDNYPEFKVLPQVPAPGITWPPGIVEIPAYPILPACS